MNTALLRATQVRITFSVQIRTNREAELLTILFLLLTPVWVLWWIKQKAIRLWKASILLMADITDLFVFIGKVVAITFNAYAFGLGIKP